MGRPPVPFQHYASGRKFAWPSQRDTCSLLPFRHCFTLLLRLYLPLVSLRILALSGLALRVYVGRLLLMLVYRRYIHTGFELHHRIVYLVQRLRLFSLIITRRAGESSLAFSLASISLVSNSRIVDPLSNPGCFFIHPLIAM